MNDMQTLRWPEGQKRTRINQREKRGHGLWEYQARPKEREGA